MTKPIAGVDDLKYVFTLFMIENDRSANAEEPGRVINNLQICLRQMKYGGPKNWIDQMQN